MHIAKIDSSLCKKEKECPASLSCPIGAIVRTQEDEFVGPPKVDTKRCLGCGKCIRFCTAKAISMN